MSLTTHLADKNSPICKWIRELVPRRYTQKLTTEVNRSLRRKRTLEALDPAQRALVGTAIDYRIRYYFDVTPGERLVAFLGALTACQNSWFKPALLYDFFVRLDRALTRIRPARRRLSESEEHELARYCLVLALLEGVFRNTLGIANALFVTHTSPLCPLLMGEKDLLALPKDPWVCDLSELSWAFWDGYGASLTAKQALLNPILAGSRHVGGADADLVVGGCLLEIKSRTKPGIFANDLRQVVGYLLLDYEDSLRVSSVGLYMARQATLISWPVEELLASAADKVPPLPSLRASFRKVATLCSEGADVPVPTAPTMADLQKQVELAEERAQRERAQRRVVRRQRLRRRTTAGRAPRRADR